MRMSEEYIVYEVLYEGRTVYIGSGLPGRELHAKSGCSHNAGLNKLFFTDPDNMIVNIIREGLTRDESLEAEKGFIQATEPEFNIALTSRRKKGKREKFFDC